MRFLLAWELGGGFGHLAPLRAIAQELQLRGHSCVFAVRNLEPAAAYLDRTLGPVLQAPLSIHPNDPPPFEHVSYASILFGCGFHRATALTSRLNAWRELIGLCRCDGVIAHHAPTALLAAHSLSLPAALIGSGFMVPPAGIPMPGFRPDLDGGDHRLTAIDGSVLQIINQALHGLDASPLESVATLISRCHSGLFTYPELDHYACGHPQTYLGLPNFSRGVKAAWGARREPRLFAYLRPFAGLNALLQALHRLPIQLLARVTDIDLSAFASLRREGLLIVDRDIDLRAVAADCDAYVNYGAHGTVAEMLLAGKPGLLLPTTLERSLVSRRAVELGAAIIASPAADTDYETALRPLFEKPSLRTTAETFARRYSTQSREQILPQWCEGFLEQAIHGRS